MPAKNPMDEILLGIDYGTANIGLALGRNGLVLPIKVINGKNDAAAITDINRMIIENKADKLVLGLPLLSNGKDTKQSLIVRSFCKKLKLFTKKQVVLVDEHSSTIDVKEEMLNAGVSQKRRGTKDAYSAALILHHYYNIAKNSTNTKNN